MYNVDERGSKDQRLLYDFLVELYPQYEIIYEFPLHDINQRLDLFIPYLGICLEYNGRQHYEFIEHFHKDISGFNLSLFQDKKKASYLYEKGIKLVVIPYNNVPKTKEELKQLIDSTDYPMESYTILESTNTYKQAKLKSQSDYRKQQYQKYKAKKQVINDNSSDQT